jgi:hypothetical protein
MISEVSFNDLGYYIADLNKSDLKSLHEEISNITTSSNEILNNVVDGHISSTVRITKSLKDLENIVMPIFHNYNYNYNFVNRYYSVLNGDLPFVMDDAWVSFQKKYEYNPAHTHPGIASFVIFLKIPFTIDEELKLSPGDSYNPNSGNFSFYYTDILGNVQREDLKVDKSWENKLILFPARLKHSVSPFYSSDETRITVAGNIKFGVKK